MLHIHALKSLYMTSSRCQLVFLQDCRAYSSRFGSNDSDAADLDAAREWYQRLNKSTLPEKIARTSFSKSSGPGGQKTNKSNTKATTVWEMYALYPHVPKALHQGLRDCRYYVSSSDSIIIQSDTARSQSDNKAETHKRLFGEIMRIYKQRVPGVTPTEQRKKVEQLQKLENETRIRTKRLHSNKKRSRSSGGGRGED